MDRASEAAVSCFVPGRSAPPPATRAAGRRGSDLDDRWRLWGLGEARTGPDRHAPRLDLDDLVLRVGDALVVHAQQLMDERLADSLHVAQDQVALVELAVG